VSEEALNLLRRIAVAVEKLANASAAATPNVATDRDLDSRYGDEVVRLNPRDWTGPPFKGRRMSECPAAFLDMLADTYVYFARKNDEAGAVSDNGKKKSDFDRRTEGRARGWAKRIRKGRYVQAAAESSDAGSDWSEGGGESEWAAGAGDGF
jgi:hypothetical protein